VLTGFLFISDLRPKARWDLTKIGRWYPLAERLSRWARIRLLKLVLKEQTQMEVARACGVCRQAVSNWLTKEAYHPNDRNASVLLRLAWEVDGGRVKDILWAEARRYSSELRRVGIAL